MSILNISDENKWLNIGTKELWASRHSWWSKQATRGTTFKRHSDDRMTFGRQKDSQTTTKHSNGI